MKPKIVQVSLHPKQNQMNQVAIGSIFLDLGSDEHGDYKLALHTAGLGWDGTRYTLICPHSGTKRTFEKNEAGDLVETLKIYNHWHPLSVAMERLLVEALTNEFTALQGDRAAPQYRQASPTLGS